jgi:hypothetical protein
VFFFPGVKRLERDSDYLPPNITEVNNECAGGQPHLLLVIHTGLRIISTMLYISVNSVDNSRAPYLCGPAVTHDVT